MFVLLQVKQSIGVVVELRGRGLACRCRLLNDIFAMRVVWHWLTIFISISSEDTFFLPFSNKFSISDFPQTMPNGGGGEVERRFPFDLLDFFSYLNQLLVSSL